MRARAPQALPVALILLVVVAGCAAPDPAPSTQAGTSSVAPASAGTGPPPGWVADPCDQREPAFSAPLAPRELFRRNGTASAQSFAAHVVESDTDRLGAPTATEATPGRNDAAAWQTHRGVVEVFWETDPGAWSAEYRATYSLAADGPPPANQTAHAILGSLGVPLAGAAWSVLEGHAEARRDTGGAARPLIRVDDQEVMAEQSRILRRDVRVWPDYEASPAGIGVEEARNLAREILACHAARDGVALRAAAGEERRVVHGIEAFWFPVEPEAGWDAACGWEKAGTLHLALDAGTGTVLSSALAC